MSRPLLLLAALGLAGALVYSLLRTTGGDRPLQASTQSGPGGGGPAAAEAPQAAPFHGGPEEAGREEAPAVGLAREAIADPVATADAPAPPVSDADAADRVQVRGRLLFSDGQPAGGARLAFPEFGDRNWFRPSAEILRTDAEGLFEARLAAGRYRWTASHPLGERVYADPVDVEGETDLGDLFLQLGGSLELAVVSAADGTAVEAAEIEEVNIQDQFAGAQDEAEMEAFLEKMIGEMLRVQLLALVRTPPEEVEEGVYRFAGLEAGLHRFQVTASGHLPQKLDVVVEAGDVARRRIELLDGVRLVVEATDAAGEPAVNHPIAILRSESGSVTHHATRNTNDGGRAVFEELEAGSYSIQDGQVTQSGGGGELAKRSLVQGENRVQVVLAPRFALEVRVTDARGTVAGARVSARLAEDPRAQETRLVSFALGRKAGGTETDADGIALLPPMTAGTYRITAQRDGGLPAEETVTLTGPAQRLEVVLEGLALEGWVRNAPSNCKVHLTRAEAPATFGVSGGQEELPVQILMNAQFIPRSVTSADCDAEGRFLFQDLAPGTYLLRAEAAGFYTEGHLEVELQPTGHEPVEILLLQESQLTLRATGLPAIGAVPYTVQVFDMEDAPSGDAMHLRADGEYQLRKVPPGSYVLRITKGWTERRLVAEFPVHVGPEHRTVVEWDAVNTP